MGGSITAIKILMRRRRIDSNPACSQGASGNLADRVAEPLLIGENRKAEIGAELGKLKTIGAIAPNAPKINGVRPNNNSNDNDRES